MCVWVCVGVCMCVCVCVCVSVCVCVPGSRPSAGVGRCCGDRGRAAAPSLSSEPPSPAVCSPAAEVEIQTPPAGTSTPSPRPAAGKCSSCLLPPPPPPPLPPLPSMRPPPLPRWCFLRQRWRDGRSFYPVLSSLPPPPPPPLSLPPPLCSVSPRSCRVEAEFRGLWWGEEDSIPATPAGCKTSGLQGSTRCLRLNLNPEQVQQVKV